MERRTKRRLWYAAVVVVSVVGSVVGSLLAGVAAYVYWRDREPETAKRLLLIGGVLFVLHVLLFAGMIWSYLSVQAELREEQRELQQLQEERLLRDQLRVVDIRCDAAADAVNVTVRNTGTAAYSVSAATVTVQAVDGGTAAVAADAAGAGFTTPGGVGTVSASTPLTADAAYRVRLEMTTDRGTIALSGRCRAA